MLSQFLAAQGRQWCKATAKDQDPCSFQKRNQVSTVHPQKQQYQACAQCRIRPKQQAAWSSAFSIGRLIIMWPYNTAGEASPVNSGSLRSSRGKKKTMPCCGCGGRSSSWGGGAWLKPQFSNYQLSSPYSDYGFTNPGGSGWYYFGRSGGGMTFTPAAMKERQGTCCGGGGFRRYG